MHVHMDTSTYTCEHTHIHTKNKHTQYIQTIQRNMKNIQKSVMFQWHASHFSLWVFPKIVVPPNHQFVHRVFPYFHHPFWGTHPYFWFNTLIGPIQKHEQPNPFQPPSVKRIRTSTSPSALKSGGIKIRLGSNGSMPTYLDSVDFDGQLLPVPMDPSMSTYCLIIKVLRYLNKSIDSIWFSIFKMIARLKIINTFWVLWTS